MRLARICQGEIVDFAVDRPDGAWVPLSAMGVLAASVGEAITALPRLEPEAVAEDDTATDIALSCPAYGAGKVIGIGMNYADHAAQSGRPIPEQPLVFSKFTSALNGPFDPIYLPDMPLEVELECEIALVIGTSGRDIAVEDALRHVFGFAVANDVSARNLQRVDQVDLGKGMDSFCPFGPWITTTDRVDVSSGLEVRSWVNGTPVQCGNSTQMIKDFASLISFVSTFLSLHPGDVILTGTPGRVEKAPPAGSALIIGDVVRCEVEGLGSIENCVKSAGSA